MSGAFEELQQQAEQLRSGVLLGEGFQLYLVSYPSLGEQTVFVRSLERSPDLHVDQLVPRERQGALVIDDIARASKTCASGEKTAVVVTLSELDQRTFSRLNEHREALMRQAPCAVVLCGGPRFLESFRKAAPDLWSVRSGDYELPALSSTIRWLHLSDLHLGQPGREVWWQVSHELRQSLAKMLPRLGGPPHLVLLTGDLAFSGQAAEYEQVDRFLDALCGWLTELGAPVPLIVAVPGNHDVTRPANDREARAFRLLNDYEKGDDPEVVDLRKQLWTERDPSPVAPLFREYTTWSERRGPHPGPLPGGEGAVVVESNRSFFPGDLSLIVEVGGFRLGLVGLNATWAQYRGGDFEGRLQLPSAQLQAALAEPDDDPLSFFRRCHRALLLMHQPPKWLSKRAEAEFNEAVYTPNRFSLCLHGHLHEGRGETVNLFGASRSYFQARSLFGLEHYGTLREDRTFGYAFGSISREGEVRVWPLWRTLRGAGHQAFDRDQRWENYDETGAVQLRPPESPGAAATSPDGPAVSRDRLDDYRSWALDWCGDLEVRAVGAGHIPIRIEDVYVPLRINSRAPAFDCEEPGCGRLALDRGVVEDFGLLEAFERAKPNRCLAIFGEPGAGKTTALRKLMHQVLTEGGASIGLSSETLPVFLRLRRLNRDRLGLPLSGFIESELEEMATGRFTGLGEGLWRRGNLLLLLDGLDEIAEERLRAEVCTYLGKQVVGHESLAWALSCRYAGYGGEVQLGSRFLHLDVRPLDDRLIAQLIRAWFRAALRAKFPEKPLAEAELLATAEADDLIAKLGESRYSDQQIKVLVSNPLLLSLLCVVVLSGGQIPEDRAHFYSKCLEVLLGAWARGREAEPPLLPDDALTLLRPLAYFLHHRGRRDDLRSSELLRVIEPYLAPLRHRLGHELQGLEVREWLHRRAGVITEYAPDHYGFMHLGFQEYLAAVHISLEGGALIRDLAAHIGEKWWEEVLLLSLALPEHHVFEPLMAQVAKSDVLVRELDLLRRCLSESHEVMVRPFLLVFRRWWRNRERESAVLRLFADRRDPEILAIARRLAKDRRFPEVATTALGLLEVPGEALIEPTTDIRFLLVPGGRVEVGSDEIGFPFAFKPHWEEVAPFWLAETPVTNGQYAHFMRATGSKEPDYWRDRRFSEPEQPVVGVSWNDAVAFCQWLTKQWGREVLLPTEVQWEAAARGSDGRRYPWGNEEPDAKRACFGQDWSEGRSAQVGSYPAGRGPFGHFDLAGNVWEWCRDDVSEDFHKDANFLSGEDLRALRALRGGGWYRGPRSLLSAYRFGYPARLRSRVVGFRVAAASTVLSP